MKPNWTHIEAKNPLHLQTWLRKRPWPMGIYRCQWAGTHHFGQANMMGLKTASSWLVGPAMQVAEPIGHVPHWFWHYTSIGHPLEDITRPTIRTQAKGLFHFVDITKLGKTRPRAQLIYDFRPKGWEPWKVFDGPNMLHPVGPFSGPFWGLKHGTVEVDHSAETCLWDWYLSVLQNYNTKANDSC